MRVFSLSKDPSLLYQGIYLLSRSIKVHFHNFTRSFSSIQPPLLYGLQSLIRYNNNYYVQCRVSLIFSNPYDNGAFTNHNGSRQLKKFRFFSTFTLGEHGGQKSPNLRTMWFLDGPYISHENLDNNVLTFKDIRGKQKTVTPSRLKKDSTQFFLCYCFSKNSPVLQIKLNNEI